jgi:hypothetical protein
MSSARRPTTPIAERLEYVRTEIAQIDNVRAFWDSLGGAEGTGVSYESARYYHHNREAPARYLIAVSDRFDIDLTWLLRGSGTPRGDASIQDSGSGRSLSDQEYWEGLGNTSLEEFLAETKWFEVHDGAPRSEEAIHLRFRSLEFGIAATGIWRRPKLLKVGYDILVEYMGSSPIWEPGYVRVAASSLLRFDAAASIPDEIVAVSHLYASAAAAWAYRKAEMQVTSVEEVRRIAKQQKALAEMAEVAHRRLAGEVTKEGGLEEIGRIRKELEEAERDAKD